MIEGDDDIGWHWDKDYGMEARGINVHPCLATVTYLSDLGGPTVILEKRVKKSVLPISLLCLQQPLVGVLKFPSIADDRRQRMLSLLGKMKVP